MWCVSIENESEIIIHSKNKKYEDDKNGFCSFIGSVLSGKL